MTILVLALAIAQGVEPPFVATATRALHDYAGCWSVDGRELDTNVDTFSQGGAVLISVDRATGGLRLDEIYRVREATGSYRRLPAERQFTELIYYDPATRLFAIRAVDAAASAATRVSLTLAGASVDSHWVSMFRSEARGMDLLASHRRRFVHPDRIEMRSYIRDPHGSFEELYSAVWARLPVTDSRCASFGQ